MRKRVKIRERRRTKGKITKRYAPKGMPRS